MMMQKIVSAAAVGALLFSSGLAHAGQSLNCGNAPAEVWGEYWCLNATIVSATELREVTFGKCEGSRAAEEEEPVDFEEFASLSHQPALAAHSREWRAASAFNVTTKAYGAVTLYLLPETFASEPGQVTTARLRTPDNESVHISCGVSAL